MRAASDKAASHATTVMRRICTIAGSADIIDDARVELARAGVLAAIRSRDTGAICDWLLETVSYQGVSDAAAFSYMENHGRIRARAIAKAIGRDRCPKLKSYWHFSDCGYRKLAKTCVMPDLLGRCSLPRHDLRNGRLNQTAYSLWLFLRDVAGGDLVTWLDGRLAQSAGRPAYQLAAAVLDPMRNVYGVSDKVLSMALSMLLLAGDPDRDQWRQAGGAMIAIDTLVHNWFHRTGILRRLNREHAYGAACNGDDGCSSIIRRAASRIDAREFNTAFPRTFPRFVQHAIWNFCAQGGMNWCNGNRIDDTQRCDDVTCPLFGRCDRIALTPARSAD